MLELSFFCGGAARVSFAAPEIVTRKRGGVVRKSRIECLSERNLMVAEKSAIFEFLIVSVY